MKNVKNLLFVALFFVTATILAQTKVTGTVVDENNQPLPGASVLEKGTTNGTETDFDGKFTLNAASESGVLVISYLGYTTQEVAFSSSKANVGTLTMAVGGNLLDEIVVVGKGVIDLAQDRKTPVAASTIRAAEIQSKLGNLEFPEVLNATPSVYATRQGGGYGDSRINVRGFNQRNTSFIINGQPVNDMENGWVYWSNWQGLSDVASGIQIQRGLGASKLAVPSVGGTVTIVTKSTEKEEGGKLLSMVGNDGYYKNVISYNSGVNDNGWAASILLGSWQGDGYVDGTMGRGTTYFVSLGYKPSDEHAFNFTFTGAGQWHHQRDVWVSIRDYQNFGKDHKDGIDRRWNSNGGTLNGVGGTGDFMTILPGAINTFALIISSYTIVLALKTAKQKDWTAPEGLMGKLMPDQKSAVRNYLLATFLLGSMFIVLKLVEWSHLVAEGFSIGVQPAEGVIDYTGQAASIFYISTGAHGVHVFVGLLVMLYLIFKADTVGYDEKNAQGIEYFGLYWHFVDLAWVVIFPAFYLY